MPARVAPVIAKTPSGTSLRLANRHSLLAFLVTMFVILQCILQVSVACTDVSHELTWHYVQWSIMGRDNKGGRMPRKLLKKLLVGALLKRKI